MSDAYQSYLTTHYKRAHAADFERVSRGYEAVYYDCLPDDPGAPILDLGCGMGEFLHFLEQRGYSACEGVEVGAEQAAEAARRVKSEVHRVEDPLAFLAARPGRYRLIAMNYVIEHVPKPQVVPLLKAVRAALEPGGALVLTTDNAARFTGLLARYNDFTHEWIYTELSLNQVTDLAGFTRFRLLPPSRPPCRTLRSLVGRTLYQGWTGVLRLIHFLERPGDHRPRVLDTPLAAEVR